MCYKNIIEEKEKAASVLQAYTASLVSKPNNNTSIEWDAPKIFENDLPSTQNEIRYAMACRGENWDSTTVQVKTNSSGNFINF